LSFAQEASFLLWRRTIT